jgi:DNA-binding protein HU-beta
MPHNKAKKTNINKKDLTEKLASRAGIPKTKASQYIDQITLIISEALMSGKKVTISDFGTFNLSERSSFIGYDPRNNKRINVPRRVIPVFRSGKKLKNALNLPMIQDVVLIGAKTVELKFSRLVHLEDTNVLKKKNYTIQLNGEKVDINAIKIAQKSTESTHNKEKEELRIEGIQSVHISFHTNLFNKEVDVNIKHPPQDVHGNSAPKSISWPR